MGSFKKKKKKRTPFLLEIKSIIHALGSCSLLKEVCVILLGAKRNVA